MNALVLREGQAQFEQRPIPVAGPTDVIVRTTMASVCSADLACINGDFGTPEGCVLGHEAVGVIHEIGLEVSGFAIGQRVAVASTTPCGQCASCQRGFSGQCGNVAWGGYSYGTLKDGSLAEYFTVPFAKHNLVAIPDDVDDAAAVCVTDTIASGSTGPECANFPLGATVVIFGQGHIGLAATMTARTLGAGLVITVKARPGGEELARQVGADIALNLTDFDVPDEIARLTGGLGADCVIEATGVISSFSTAVSVTRLGGTTVVLSSYEGGPDASLAIPLASWGAGVGDQRILSTFQRSGSERLGRLLGLVGKGRLDPSPLMGRTYTFDEAVTAIEDVAARRVIKPLITY
jgi:threonine dehydrogenase-like Zn-dependent dehydrogenase